MKVVITLTKRTDVHYVHKEHTAQEELFHGVLIALLVKQWDVVMVVHRVTVVGVSQFMK